MRKYFVVLLICVCIITISLLVSTVFDVPVMAPAYECSYTLILDAGHGGEDGGALSAAGDKESMINLSIVLRLDQLMGFCGTPAVLTRTDDRSIHDVSAKTIREKKVSDLRNRVKIVKTTENAVLMSVHQNSYEDSRYSGAQVFFGTSGASQTWGEIAQELLRISLDPSNERTAKQIPDTVYLMKQIQCPAILVECGFLSNTEEAQLLLTADYQKKVATALAGACLRFLYGNI